MRILRVAELVECPVGCRSVLEPATFSASTASGEYPESLWNRCVIISTLLAPFTCSGGAALPDSLPVRHGRWRSRSSNRPWHT